MGEDHEEGCDTSEALELSQLRSVSRIDSILGREKTSLFFLQGGLLPGMLTYIYPFHVLLST